MYRIKQLTFFLGDLVMLYAGLYAGLTLRYFSLPALDQRFSNLLYPFTYLFIVAAAIMFIVGLYDLGRAKNTWAFYQKIIITAAIWVLIGIIYFYINPRTLITPKTTLLLTSVSGFGLIALWRYFNNRFLSSVIWRNYVVFVGITPETIELIALMRAEPERGFDVVGVVGDGEALPSSLATVPQARQLSELAQPNGKQTMPAGRQAIHLIIVAPQFAADQNLLKELYQNLFRQAEIIDLAKFYETLMGRIPPFTFSESWFLTNLREQQKKIYDRFRALIDYAVALIIGIFFIPTLPLIALAIKLTSPGPIFFSQERVGRLDRPFRIYKYRTMRTLNADGSAETNGPQFAATKDARVTAVGRFLRRTRLDEIPQFINILRGEMSLVGPRPERPEFVKQLTVAMPFYALRHLIKPGLTGWAQIHKSYYGNIEENLFKLQYDLYYLKNRGPLLDLIILLKTINTLVKMAGR